MKGEKMQNVSFRTVEDFLDFLPDDERQVAIFLRELVFESLPYVSEHLAYNVPFYRIRKNICFVWPASVLWGRRKTYSGVRFGFSCGDMLTDPENYLDRGGRKSVYWRDFLSISDIDSATLKNLLYQAEEYDRRRG